MYQSITCGFQGPEGRSLLAAGEEGEAAFEFLMQNGARYTQQTTKELPQLPAMMPEAKLPQAKFSSLVHVYSNSSLLDSSGSLGLPS